MGGLKVNEIDAAGLAENIAPYIDGFVKKPEYGIFGLCDLQEASDLIDFFIKPREMPVGTAVELLKKIPCVGEYGRVDESIEPYAFCMCLAQHGLAVVDAMECYDTKSFTIAEGDIVSKGKGEGIANREKRILIGDKESYDRNFLRVYKRTLEERAEERLNKLQETLEYVRESSAVNREEAIESCEADISRFNEELEEKRRRGVSNFVTYEYLVLRPETTNYRRTNLGGCFLGMVKDFPGRFPDYMSVSEALKIMAETETSELVEEKAEQAKQITNHYYGDINKTTGNGSPITVNKITGNDSSITTDKNTEPDEPWWQKHLWSLIILIVGGVILAIILSWLGLNQINSTPPQVSLHFPFASTHSLPPGQ